MILIYFTNTVTHISCISVLQLFQNSLAFFSSQDKFEHLAMGIVDVVTRTSDGMPSNLVANRLLPPR